MGNSTETKKIIGALIVGVACGAAIGILFAPNKGCITRNKVLGKTKRLEEDLKNRMKQDIIAFRSRANQLEMLVANNMKEIDRQML